MARASLDNFGDVWPPRNGGVDADPWLAHAEARIIGLERRVQQLGQETSGANRTNVGKADVIADQIAQLYQQQAELSRQQELLAEQQVEVIRQQVALEEQNKSILLLFNSLPIADGRQVRENNWTVDIPSASGNWKTVASATIQRPEGMTRAAVTAVGSASGVSSNLYNAAMVSRIVVNGTASPIFEGAVENLASNIRSNTQSSFFREISSLTGPVTVSLQVAGRYTEYPGTNIANLTVSVGFTRTGI